jgi:hypothetical protein
VWNWRVRKYYQERSKFQSGIMWVIRLFNRIIGKRLQITYLLEYIIRENISSIDNIFKHIFFLTFSNLKNLNYLISQNNNRDPFVVAYIYIILKDMIIELIFWLGSICNPMNKALSIPIGSHLKLLLYLFWKQIKKKHKLFQ